MTLSSTTVKRSYSGDGDTVEFATGFPFQKNADVTAILRASGGTETTWTEGTQYTLVGAGEASGGTLTVITDDTDYTPAAGETLVIKRSPALTQDTALPLGGPLPSKSVEDALDRLMMVCQALDERLDRALVFSETSTTTAVTVPDPIANEFLLWNSAGTALISVGIAAIDSSLDALFTSLAANDFVQYNGTNWVNKSPTQVASAISAYTVGGTDVAVTDGGTGSSTAAGARTNLGLVIGTDVLAPTGSGTSLTGIVKTASTAVLTAGYSATPYNAGTKSSGTYTPDESNGNLQYAVNGGAHTLAPPTNNCTIIVQYTNNASAGAITVSGFTSTSGDSFTTTNGDDFFAYITKLNGFSHLHVEALQ